ncbi:TraR/DksA C4-type zinc finger protein [Domibacillus indicus]|uniref:TraR/DksA C4-type zinc finger protein n=1 Tax=Domibacillus indicus TaxID=1437523 RepID=UPI000617B250|nr:TraR/DksA C4-type zinc finger protein [Domibacillus indicus]
MLNKTQLANFQTELTNRKKELTARFEDNDKFQTERGLPDSTGELSLYDNHPGDTATEEFERGKDIALNEHAKLELLEINRALEAIQNGTYGICKVCKKEIPFERLEAIPTTLFCTEDSKDQNISNDRSIEERFLAPAFKKFDMDVKDENVAFDSEDSWQEVARYGTSESPSDFADPPEDYEDMYVESQENVGYVEDYENFAAVDINGRRIDVYPSKEHENYEDSLDEEDLMTPIGDLPAFEHEPYTDKD